MARKKKQTHERARRFADTDLAWLAEEFKRQIESDPTATLEDFALHYGIPPEWIRRYVDQSEQPILVWHGTTVDRADAIRNEGFKAPPGRGRIWFTRKANEARQIAKNRAAQRGSEPVVFGCHINLGQYSDVERPRPDWYVFRHSRLDKTVIRSVVGVEKRSEKKLPKQKRRQHPGQIDVVVTNTSGKAGVLCWINVYLEQMGQPLIDVAHPGINAIWAWVQEQYADGRLDPISDEEMAVQVNMHFITNSDQKLALESGSGEVSQARQAAASRATGF